MPKLNPAAVRTLDAIVRNTRTSIEDRANMFARTRGEDEATPDDVAEAARVIFESDCSHLIRKKS